MCWLLFFLLFYGIYIYIYIVLVYVWRCRYVWLPTELSDDDFPCELYSCGYQSNLLLINITEANKVFSISSGDREPKQIGFTYDFFFQYYRWYIRQKKHGISSREMKCRNLCQMTKQKMRIRRMRRDKRSEW